MRVLIADDDPVWRQLLEQNVRSWGYEPVTAEDGTSAWAVLQQDPHPRIAILDWLMPGLDGVEVCRRIRGNPHLPLVFTILLTGRDTSNDVVAGLESGADEYLVKPVNLRVLRSHLAAAARIVESAPPLLRDFEHHLRYTLAKDEMTATSRDHYHALALAVRDQIIERWMITQQTHHKSDVKRVYYLSMEFLIGRLLGNNVSNLRLQEVCREAMSRRGLDWESLRDHEVDAGLGNGGLGRLAACFLDSLSTLAYPAIGYGLRYEYGIFSQRIERGYQVEDGDAWLRQGYPWEIARPEFSFNVHFGGRVELFEREGRQQWRWIDVHTIRGMPYDLPVVGYGGQTVNALRLWSAKATEEFDLEDFNRGSYVEAVAAKVQAENLTKVLYPNDNVFEGKELRLQQEYFLVSCSLQDILRRFRNGGHPWSALPQKAFVQLNDTHPALAIPELMRLLMDDHGLGWDEAWSLTSSCIGYTNHTVLPEAMELWPVPMLERLLPRHLQIIYEINARFLRGVATRYPMDHDRLRRMSLIDEGRGRQVRMAQLAVVGACSVNGVSQLHTDLLRREVLRDFAEYWPEKFNNKTNGITPRRWLLNANPGLSALITEVIGDGWIVDLEALRRLEPLAADPAFQERFAKVKRQNKLALAALIQERVNTRVSADSLFDVQVKRLHEYKRQLMLTLYGIIRYNRLRQGTGGDPVPRTIILAGKAAPGFAMAKLIIKLVNQVAEVVNNDPLVQDRLKIVFVPNYGVSLAERIIPAADLSEQISLAGTEASGTGNMKLQLNGALTIGTPDGANLEIQQEVGADQMFMFGMNAQEVAAQRGTYRPWDLYRKDPELRQALDMIRTDFFSMLEPGIFAPITHALLDGGDGYRVLADLPAFSAAQDRVDALYRQPALWNQMAILNVARCGKFSSDRTIREYAREVWHIEPCPVP